MRNKKNFLGKNGKFFRVRDQKTLELSSRIMRELKLLHPLCMCW